MAEGAPNKRAVINLWIRYVIRTTNFLRIVMEYFNSKLEFPVSLLLYCEMVIFGPTLKLRMEGKNNFVVFLYM